MTSVFGNYWRDLKRASLSMFGVSMTHTKCMAVIIALVWSLDASSAVTEIQQKSDPCILSFNHHVLFLWIRRKLMDHVLVL